MDELLEAQIALLAVGDIIKYFIVDNRAKRVKVNELGVTREFVIEKVLDDRFIGRTNIERNVKVYKNTIFILNDIMCFFKLPNYYYNNMIVDESFISKFIF